LSVGLFVCALAKKWLFWFFERWLECRKKPNVPFAGRLFTLSDNGSGLAEGLDFEKRQPIKALKLIEKLLFKICTSASLLANPCSSSHVP
jgi:hypothetical protein